MFRPESRPVIGKVHKIFSAHSTFSDMKVLLHLNGAWSEDFSTYLLGSIARFSACSSTYKTKLSRKVSLYPFNRYFNEFVFVDHFLLDDIRIFSIMNAQSCYSGEFICGDVSLASSVQSFETLWIAPSWPLEAYKADNALKFWALHHLAIPRHKSSSWSYSSPLRKLSGI